MDTRITLAEQIQEYVFGNSDRSRDEKLDRREVFAKMDQVANAYARIGRLENMKEGVFGASACYMTLFPGIKVEAHGKHQAKVKLPATFMQISHNRGIAIFSPGKFDEVFVPVSISFARAAAYRLGGDLEGRVGFFVSYDVDGPKAIFLKPIHACDPRLDKVDIQLAIVDSSVISDDAPYPIDPQWANDFVKEVGAWFLPKTQLPTDEVNDGVTKQVNSSIN